MGKHFDALVDLVKAIGFNEHANEIPCAKKYLESVVRDCTLFEFPLRSEEVFSRTGKTTQEYVDYLGDYFEMSARHGSFFLTPFPLTAVEDDVSVVVMQNMKDNKYVLVSSRKGLCTGDDSTFVYFGSVKLRKPSGAGMWAEISPYYCTRFCDGVRAVPNDREALANALMTDIHADARAYVEQVVYLMDPANFIIRKENRACRKYYDKPAHKRPTHFVPKTVMRPHYVCLSEQDTRDFLQSSSKEPRAAHPVRGHFRTLVSERWTHKRGQTVFVRQYFTGQGRIDGANGWTYEVMVKEAPDRMVPYSQAKSL